MDVGHRSTALIVPATYIYDSPNVSYNDQLIYLNQGYLKNYLLPHLDFPIPSYSPEPPWPLRICLTALPFVPCASAAIQS